MQVHSSYILHISNNAEKLKSQNITGDDPGLKRHFALNLNIFQMVFKFKFAKFAFKNNQFNYT